MDAGRPGTVAEPPRRRARQPERHARRLTMMTLGSGLGSCLPMWWRLPCQTLMTSQRGPAEIGDELSAEARLRLVLRAFAAAPLGADTPQLLISQAVAATGASGGVVCGVRGDCVVILASEGYTPDQGVGVRPAHHGGSVLAPERRGNDRTAGLAGVAGRYGRSISAHWRTRSAGRMGLRGTAAESKR